MVHLFIGALGIKGWTKRGVTAFMRLYHLFNWISRSEVKVTHLYIETKVFRLKSKVMEETTRGPNGRIYTHTFVWGGRQEVQMVTYILTHLFGDVGKGSKWLHISFVWGASFDSWQFQLIKSMIWWRQYETVKLYTLLLMLNDKNDKLSWVCWHMVYVHFNSCN